MLKVVHFICNGSWLAAEYNLSKAFAGNVGGSTSITRIHKTLQITSIIISHVKECSDV